MGGVEAPERVADEADPLGGRLARALQAVELELLELECLREGAGQGGGADRRSKPLGVIAIVTSAR